MRCRRMYPNLCVQFDHRPYNNPFVWEPSIWALSGSPRQQGMCVPGTYTCRLSPSQNYWVENKWRTWRAKYFVCTKWDKSLIEITYMITFWIVLRGYYCKCTYSQWFIFTYLYSFVFKLISLSLSLSVYQSPTLSYYIFTYIVLQLR